MRRNARDTLFTLVLLALVAAAVWEARGWQIRAGLFPNAIGIPLLLLLIAQLALVLTRGSMPSQPAMAEGRQVEADPATVRRRVLSITFWLLAFAGAIWVLGFPIGSTLATLAYLKLAAREKWPISLAVSAGILTFFWGMNALNVLFPKGLLAEWLGLGAPLF